MITENYTYITTNLINGKQYVSEETKKKMRRIEKCIYCGKEMNISNLMRYHNENCKNKK